MKKYACEFGIRIYAKTGNGFSSITVEQIGKVYSLIISIFFEKFNCDKSFNEIRTKLRKDIIICNFNINIKTDHVVREMMGL